MVLKAIAGGKYPYSSAAMVVVRGELSRRMLLDCGLLAAMATCPLKQLRTPAEAIPPYSFKGGFGSLMGIDAVRPGRGVAGRVSERAQA